MVEVVLHNFWAEELRTPWKSRWVRSSFLESWSSPPESWSDVMDVVHSTLGVAAAGLEGCVSLDETQFNGGVFTGPCLKRFCVSDPTHGNSYLGDGPWVIDS